MNVLLIYPYSQIEWNNKYEEPRIPMSITYLGAAIRESGHTVQLLDLRVLQQKREIAERLDADDIQYLQGLLSKRLQSEKFDIVGINCLYSGLFPVVLELLKEIKKQSPSTYTVTGGIHPTIFPTEILSEYHSILDYIILGEGEAVWVELLDCLYKNDENRLSTIDGIAFYQDGKLVHNPKTKFVEDLDSIPFPAVDLLNIEDYFIDTSSWYSPKGIDIKTPVPVLTSRSCPNQCNFCSMHLVHGKRIRFRSPENVVEELKRYVNEYGLRYFNFTDDNLTLNKKRLLQMMNLIVRENLDISFSTENGVYIGSLDEEVLDAMTQAGLARIHLAFETGSEYIRNKVMGKHLSNGKIEEVQNLFLKSKYNSVYIYGYFIIGMPEETEDTLEETYQLIKRFPLDNFSLFYAIPLPGTRLYEQCYTDRLFLDKVFYDRNALSRSTAIGQMVKGEPIILPYQLDIPTLVSFKEKGMDYLDQIRNASPLPRNRPLRLNQ